MAEDRRTNGMGGPGRQVAERELFWELPLPLECIHFVDSPDSEAFSCLLLALERATVIAMDAEWKPLFGKSPGSANPRVSILQIACRLQGKPRVRKEIRENGRHVKANSRIRAKDKEKANLMGSQTTAELAARSEQEDESSSDSEGGDEETVQASGSESESGSDRGDQLQESPEFQDKPVNRNFRETQATSELRERPNWEKEELKDTSKLDCPLANVQESTVKTFQGPEPEREFSGSSSSHLSAEDATPVTDKTAPGRTGESDDGREKEMRRGTLLEEKKACQEMIFFLDLLELPASAFSEVLKEVLVDPMVLKLGFGFKQDLIHLRGTFPGPDALGCFDKVEPYLDVGKLYRHLHKNQSFFTHRGKRIMIGGDGLSSISETILGFPLRKDMQCSNWELRPLTAGQFDYAAADAYCLLAIFDVLQVKASESWFSPIVAGDDEGVLQSRSEVGVAGLLAPLNLGGNGHTYATVSICQPKRGNATVMVEAAMAEAGFSGVRRGSEDRRPSKTDASKTLRTDALVRRFGEKLLISGGQGRTTSKRTRRKTRSRRAKEAGKTHEVQDEADVEYVGPAPWDPAVGGDGTPKFLCDAMVEGLARQLRCVGVDAASPNSRKCDPRELVDIAEKEGRIILTRDVKLLRRRLVPTDLAYRVKQQGKWLQLSEIIKAFKLVINEDKLLSRCTKCNGHIMSKSLSAKEAVAQRPANQVIPESALKCVDEFWQCGNCKHVYWQGTQFTRAYKQFTAVCDKKRAGDQD